MALTLGNDLTGLVSREVDAAGSRATGLGSSLTSGNNQFVSVVDGFLGNSLRDGEIVLGALAKNTAYSINLLTITNEYLNSIGKTMTESLETIGASDGKSLISVATLQKNLSDQVAQLNLLISTADFDGKALLAGDATTLVTRVGLSIADKITLRVADISGGKLLRIGAANAINDYLGAAVGRVTTPAFQTQAALDLAVAQRTNFAQTAVAGLTDVQLATAVNFVSTKNASFARIDEGNLSPLLKVQIAVAMNVRLDGAVLAAAAGGDLLAANGAGNGGLAANVSAAVQAVITAQGAVVGPHDVAATANAIEAAVKVQLVHAAHNAHRDGAALQAKNVYINLANNALGLSSVGVADLTAALGNAPARAQFQALLGDNQATNITTDAGRALSQDVITSALTAVRSIQASVTNQKNNVVGAADALRATTNVTQKAADSYLKTDYVLTAQQYSETIRTIVASITSLQAANKIPEAAQRLIDALAR